MTFQINGSNGNYDSYMQYLEAPLVNDKHSTAPILDFSPTEEADANNIEALEKFADENDAYLSSLPPLEYEYRYMPEGTFDKKALLATAREE
ncbi:MAG: hypothetical protein NC334_08105, partial [Bacteroides sp.]|nr:hypothetical protein [Bacteroides sp.]